ncbi:hypothetical protein Awo_c27900 [Acetobacterium woodii DSM 1030]|uniref:Uncharacterized protein n=1 Tax=Acetobacterium woodii (strain ATCC 29683 / DSM 1030 / JCM 2381 / KCTC 1655 / WB1) TaxID=931626 RepID=H6LG65_ACEWD|nr:hypothetical protein Awo_c27900 [Acetobacterium woodii DSM 1030]
MVLQCQLNAKYKNISMVILNCVTKFCIKNLGKIIDSGCKAIKYLKFVMIQ